MKRVFLQQWEVEAFLQGLKTELRRPIDPQPTDPDRFRIVGPDNQVHYTRLAGDRMLEEAESTPGYRVLALREWLNEQLAPLGAPGDVVWAPEVWAPFYSPDHPRDFHEKAQRLDTIAYKADKNWHEQEMVEGGKFKWRLSGSMPSWASRLRFRITKIWTEPLAVWPSLNRQGQRRYRASCPAADTLALESKPWIWVYRVERVQPWQ